MSNPIVIGSSPILLLYALTLANKSQPVSLILDPDNKGGCWKTTQIESLSIESSCHLLESFKYSHDFLRSLNISLTPYNKIDQPITISGSNSSEFSITPYHSRVRIFRFLVYKLTHNVKKILFFIPKLFMNKFYNRSYDLNPYSPQLFAYHHLSQLIFLEPLHRHTNGWVGFMNQLFSLISKSKYISVYYGKVKSIDDCNCSIMLNSGKSVPYSRLSISQSLVDCDTTITQLPSSYSLKPTNIQLYSTFMVVFSQDFKSYYDLIPEYIFPPIHYLHACLSHRVAMNLMFC